MRKYLAYIITFVIIIAIIAILQLIPTTTHTDDSHSNNNLNVIESADRSLTTTDHTAKDEITVTTYVEKNGPFVVKNKIFTIVMTHKKIFGDDTVESFEIIDENNLTHYKKYFGATIAEGHPDFESTIQMGAYKVEGLRGEGLIIFYTLMSNAPPSGTSCQFFGLDKQMLKSLTSELGIAGGIHKLPKGDSERTLRLLEGDVINVQIWTNYFAVTIPISVDFDRLMIKPAKASGNFDVYYPRSSLRPVGSAIIIYADHDANLKAESITLTAATTIDYLYAYAEIQLEKYESEDKIEVSNLWLKIKIDGKEGWVKDSASFYALGFYSP